MAAKKAATKQPAKAKAGITAEQLAAFMGVDTAKAVLGSHDCGRTHGIFNHYDHGLVYNHEE